MRILSESLEAPEDWRSYAAEPTGEEVLSDKVVGDALQKCMAPGAPCRIRVLGC